ncbi:MAG: hypothetical protein KAY37_15250, partial [Phycisphaerae bacterium]|nr:hypothetical protein [Phycisphaerae bacterium]
ITGACCVGTTCSVQNEYYCGVAGGIYIGDGTDCGPPDPCSDITGACCVGTTCSVQNEYYCLDAGGIYLGDGISCTPNPCIVTVCRGDSDCDGEINWRDIDYLVAAMNDNVAAWEAMFLPGTPTCSFENNDVNDDGTINWRDIDPFVALMNTTCPPAPTGACCVGATCSVQDESDCIVAGGTYLGDDTTCTPNPCPAVGEQACCYPDGSCTHETVIDCYTNGGIAQGDGSICALISCVAFVECLGDSDCDGEINWRDIDYFVAAMNDNVQAWLDMFAPALPTCSFWNNDVDEDGTVNWRDIDPFVALMNTTCP